MRPTTVRRSDGYPLDENAWADPGQITTRFEIARAIGSGSAGLFKVDGEPKDNPAFPQIGHPLYYAGIAPRLGTGHSAGAGCSHIASGLEAAYGPTSTDSMHR